MEAVAGDGGAARAAGRVQGRAGDGGGVDISPLACAGVPLLSLAQDTSRYFDWHHSAADTLDKVDPARPGAGHRRVRLDGLGAGRLSRRPFRACRSRTREPWWKRAVALIKIQGAHARPRSQRPLLVRQRQEVQEVPPRRRTRAAPPAGDEVRPGTVTPMRTVPPSIPLPSYARTGRPRAARPHRRPGRRDRADAPRRTRRRRGARPALPRGAAPASPPRSSTCSPTRPASPAAPTRARSTTTASRSPSAPR